MILGIGIDVVDVDRARRMLATYGDRILRRTCTDGEIQYVRSHPDGTHRFAARLAAKESAYKALAGSQDARAIGWKEIEVVFSEGAPPSLLFHGRAAARAKHIGMRRAWLSMTHSDLSAVATVILEGP